MAQVQYNPIPDASAQPIATPQVHINAPGEAFGTGIAKAVEHFGGNLEHAGNELFARALAIQHLNNEAETREKDSQYIVESGDLYTEYESLRGKAAVDARPKFVQDIQDLRQKKRDELSNPISQKMFDAQTQTSMARTIFSSAKHMADQNKRWQASTIEGQIDAYESQALNNPKDENLFRENITKAKFDVERLADINGVDKDNLISHHVSRLWAQRILGLSKTNPMQARDMLEKAIANKDIRGQESIKLEEVVRGKENVVISRNVSDAINSGWGGWMKQPDIDKTVGVEDGLIRVLKRVQQARPDIPFTIGEAKGEDGRSVSIVPLKKGDEQKISTAMFEAAQSLKIPLSTELSKGQQGLFSLPQDYDPRSIPKPEPESERLKVKRANDYVRANFPDREDLFDPVEKRVISDHNQEVRFRKDEEYTASQVLFDVLHNGNGPSGKLPTTVEELTMDPGAAAAWDKIDPSHQKSFRNALMKNARGDFALTPERVDRFEDLRGLSITDSEKFLDTRILDQDLTLSQQKELRNLQFKMKQAIAKGEKLHPSTTRAMRLLGEANILFPDKINPQYSESTYRKFVGNLSEELEAFRDSHNGKPPTDDEIRNIGRRLLMTTPVARKVLWDKNTRVFELNVPDNDLERIKNDPAWAENNITPTPERIQQIYVREQYQKLYGNKATIEAPAKPPKEEEKPNSSGLPTPVEPKGEQKTESVKRPLQTKAQLRAKPKPKLEGRPIIDSQGSGLPSKKVEDRRDFDPTMTPEAIEKRRRNSEMADRVLR